MDSPVIGGLLAFLGGTAVSLLNYHIILSTLKNNPYGLTKVTVLRQLFSVAYLVAVFFLARVLPWDSTPLLLGAAIGLTVPSFILSLRLAKKNDVLSSKKNDPQEKGDDSDGGTF